MKRLLKTLTNLFKKRVYLDYAAATPIRAEVYKKMRPFLGESFGNASALYAEGSIAKEVLKNARKTVANILHVRREEVVFTGGGTESNNMAISGLMNALIGEGRAYSDCEIITTKIEHPSIVEVLRHYEHKGVVIKYVEVDADGLMNEASFRKMLSPKTILVTIAYANSEIGVVQDVKTLTRIVRAHQKQNGSLFPCMHLDASQAPLYLPCAFNSLGVDMMTLDAGKFYGPKGVGVYAKKHGVPFKAVTFGGSQEMGMRPGTENIASIVGCAHALYIADRDREKRIKKVKAIRDAGFKALLSIKGAVQNGSLEKRIANNINISIPGIEGEYAAVMLDAHGFSVSTKSACSGITGTGSKVVYVLGGDDARAFSTLRITLGEETTMRNITALTRVLTKHVAHMRASMNALPNIDQVNKT